MIVLSAILSGKKGNGEELLCCRMYKSSVERQRTKGGLAAIGVQLDLFGAFYQWEK